MIAEQKWKPCSKQIKISIAEFSECYNGQIVNSFGYDYDIEKAITESDFIILFMMDYWETFVKPIADHIILRMMTEKLR